MTNRFTLLLGNENKEVEVLNLTPHVVTLLREGMSIDILPEPKAARVQIDENKIGAMAITNPGGDGIEIPVVTENYGPAEDLPSEKTGTVLLVSRLVMDRNPHRHDLLCPSDLERNQEGQTIAAKSLKVLTDPNHPAPSHLVILIGQNPTPNWEAIATLKPKHVTAIASTATEQVAKNLMATASQRLDGLKFEIVTIRNEHSVAEIEKAFADIEPNWALSYTGGTKVMSAHARLLYETRGDGRPQYASTTYNGIWFDDGNKQPLDSEASSLDLYAALHGYRLETKLSPKNANKMEYESPLPMNEIGRAMPIVRELLDDPSYIVPAERMTGLHPALQRVFTKDNKAKQNAKKPNRFSGYWFEEIVGALFNASNDEVKTGQQIVRATVSSADGSPEVDTLVRKGWTVALVSCTVAGTEPQSLARLKSKLMEAKQRASQTMGSRTNVLLACLADDETCETVARDADDGTDVPFFVFGKSDVEEWLNDMEAPVVTGLKLRKTHAR